MPTAPRGRLGPQRSLPKVQSLLAVCAHPDDETFGLGAILAAFRRQGTRTAVLSFTHGEASTLGGIGSGLAAIRREELTAAAKVLGIDHVALLDYPDGALDQAPLDALIRDVRRESNRAGASALLVFDESGITGHADHCRATVVGLAAADSGQLVLAWTIPSAVAAVLNAEFGTTFIGRQACEADYDLKLDRALQLAAIRCHVTQAQDNPVLWRRLELLGNHEWLRELQPSSRPAVVV